MGLKDGTPRIKSLLSSSLLFETVDYREIAERLGKNDHGTYSAIILLCQYYDNGRIFSLEPVERMVVELSALVIYNHTLHYSFQDEKKYDRYQNVFVDNPISYLFRLCDDMQEWERVYFQISDKSSFSICSQCMTPMICETEVKGKIVPHTCFCGEKGMDTIWFPDRHLINVAPFSSLTMESIPEKAGVNPAQWILYLNCDRKALLQLASYNAAFATQRIAGIRELQAMVKGQEECSICVSSFLSNNPIAIKVRILMDFMVVYAPGILDDFERVLISRQNFNYSWEKGCFLRQEKMKKAMLRIKGVIQKRAWAKEISRALYARMAADERLERYRFENADGKVAKLMEESLEFYLYLLLMPYKMCDFEYTFDAKDLEEYQQRLYTYCARCAQAAAQVWQILDTATIDLVADCLVLMYCDVCREREYTDTDSYRYRTDYPLRKDICEIVQKYTETRDYLEICARGKRQKESGENVFDFYSDYFLFFAMDYCLELDEKYRSSRKVIKKGCTMEE